MHILQIFDDKQLLEISHAYMMSFFCFKFFLMFLFNVFFNCARFLLGSLSSRDGGLCYGYFDRKRMGRVRTTGAKFQQR